MKFFYVIFLFLLCTVSAQKNMAFDSLQLKDAQGLFADDYGNIYLYKNKDFSFSKYDSLGKQKGKLMFTLPFRVQSVQNPLSIPAFSENAQQLKFFDQNLNEIQTVTFRQKFGFIKMVYAEDLQQIWLLEESTKRLIQYNFREDRVLNSYPIDMDFENIVDFMVFENKIYVLAQNEFLIYNFKAEKLFEAASDFGKRLRRENQDILIMGKSSVQKLENRALKTIFSTEASQIVDKNSAAYFVIRGNKLYLYRP